MAEAPQLFGSRVRWPVAALQPNYLIKNEDLGQQVQMRLEDLLVSGDSQLRSYGTPVTVI